MSVRACDYGVKYNLCGYQTGTRWVNFDRAKWEPEPKPPDPLEIRMHSPR